MDKRTLQIQYEVEEHGWARASITCRGERVEMAASYIQDSLDQLATAARVILAGGPSAEALFYGEPETWKLSFTRVDSDWVEMTVEYFDDHTPMRRSSSSGEPKLRCRVPARELGRRVLSVLAHIHRTLGEDEYKRRSHLDFPGTEYENLRALFN